MKRLLIMRHAKSSWAKPTADSPNMPDKERPLNERGERAAQLMGAYLRQEGLRPDLILCSTAVRAQQTVQLMLPFLSEKVDVEYAPNLYMADPPTIFESLQRLNGAIETVLLVGHNPGLQEAVLALADPKLGGDKKALDAIAGKFPTAALAMLEFEAPDWSGIKSGKLVLYRRPKELV